jgi:N-acetylmuramoyl-L-alanine amidase
VSLKRVWIASPNYSSRGGSGVRLVVVHTAEGTRSFRDLGNFFSRSAVQASSHVGIDDERGTIGEYVKPANKAWTQAAYNPQCISSELCGAPINSAFPCGARWTSDEWNRHPDMLANTADWIREECQRYGLPITKLSASQAQGSSKGVCGHIELGAGGGGHWDPGPNFPWNRVIDMARGQTPPELKPPATEEVEMIASAVADNGSLHTFMVGPQRKTVWYTWQPKNSSGWNGGKAGQQVAKMARFADVNNPIRGISAEKAAGGALHVFVTLDDGSTLYTWQPKGKTAWNGHGKNKIASLIPFAPKP